MNFVEIEHHFEEDLPIVKNSANLSANVTTLHGEQIKLHNLQDQIISKDLLQITKESIETHVRERTTYLTQALRARDEFLSIASHELRNPLSVLLTRLQLLKRIAEEQNHNMETINYSQGSCILSPAQVIKTVKTCEDQCKKISTLLDMLLDLTHIRIGILELRKVNINLNAVIESEVANKRQEHNNVLISIRADTPVNGNWDKMRIEQIVDNLLSNAIKYGNGNPVEILAELDSSTGTAKLSVSDQGKGISSEMQEKIFNRFERAGSDSSIQGLGLGLYIVHQIVQAHGGFIHVISELGKGSTFTVELPLNTP